MPFRRSAQHRPVDHRSDQYQDALTRATLSTFETALGWMAVTAIDRVLTQLSFGHSTRATAIRGLRLKATARVTQTAWPELAERLTAYAAGEAEDFADFEIDCGHLTPFEGRVIEHCRRIPYGQTLSYGRLAALAGSARAARAVGNVMASNRCPLLIPCHRVVHASGELGNYSARAGRRMKLRLLEQEGAWHGGKLRSPASLAVT